MIIHAKQPTFSNYRVSLNKEEITPQVYMADDQCGVIITRNWRDGVMLMEEKTGQVQIFKASDATR